MAEDLSMQKLVEVLPPRIWYLTSNGQDMWCRRPYGFLFSTGQEIPEEGKAVAMGCLRKPYSERQLKNALEAIDRLLAGEQAKACKGLELYPAQDG